MFVCASTEPDKNRKGDWATCTVFVAHPPSPVQSSLVLSNKCRRRRGKKIYRQRKLRVCSPAQQPSPEEQPARPQAVGLSWPLKVQVSFSSPKQQRSPFPLTRRTPPDDCIPTSLAACLQPPITVSGWVGPVSFLLSVLARSRSVPSLINRIAPPKTSHTKDWSPRQTIFLSPISHSLILFSLSPSLAFSQ